MEAVLDILLSASFWAAAIRIATPLMFGVLGAHLRARGVLNLGIEGIFTAGAMAGWLAVYLGLDLWSGVSSRRSDRPPFGLVLALLTVPLGLSQHVAGIGTLLATSLAYSSTGSPCRTSPRRRASSLSRPSTSRPVGAPFIGPALFQQTPLTFLALALFAAAAFVLYRTPIGLSRARRRRESGGRRVGRA